jgi:hypothetical protein
MEIDYPGCAEAATHRTFSEKIEKKHAIAVLRHLVSVMPFRRRRRASYSTRSSMKVHLHFSSSRAKFASSRTLALSSSIEAWSREAKSSCVCLVLTASGCKPLGRMRRIRLSALATQPERLQSGRERIEGSFRRPSSGRTATCPILQLLDSPQPRSSKSIACALARRVNVRKSGRALSLVLRAF